MVHRLPLRRISEETRRSDLVSSSKAAQDAVQQRYANVTRVYTTGPHSIVLAESGVEIEPFNPCTYIQPRPRRRDHNQAAQPSTSLEQAGAGDADVAETSRERSTPQVQKDGPTVPSRTTSKRSLPKRRRHDDLVSLHRTSCQLFSSLDGTLAELRSSSSSSSSSSLSSTGSPVSGNSTRETSLDYGHSSPLLGPIVTDDNGIRSLNPKPNPAIKRPYSHNTKSLSKSHLGSRARIVVTKEIDISYSPTTPVTTREIKVAPSTPPSGPTSRPPITTTPSYSSHGHAKIHVYSRRNPATTETIHWTSPETRRREYARIDAAHSGVRLFVRRIFPKRYCAKIGGGRKDFFDEKRKGSSSSEDSDCGSVRRFRLGSRVDGHGDKTGAGAEKRAEKTDHDIGPGILADFKVGPAHTQTFKEKSSTRGTITAVDVNKKRDERRSSFRSLLSCY